jgi:hypothetical protein
VKEVKRLVEDVGGERIISLALGGGPPPARLETLA